MVVICCCVCGAVLERTQRATGDSWTHSVIHFLNPWDMGHDMQLKVHIGIESTPDTDLWAILDKIGVLCGSVEQAT